MIRQPTLTTGSRRLLLALLICAWACFVIRSCQVFGPDSSYVQTFNSDSALPVLMANDEKFDLFRSYIYGQDQIGAWPFIAAQIVHRMAGYEWTPQSVYLAQTIWLCLSLILVGALCRVYAPLIALFAAVLLALHPVVRHYFFVLNQRNAWQLTALFLAWWTLRKVSNQLQLGDKPRARTLLMIVCLGLSSFLAIWSSSLSGPFLLAIAVLELLRLKMTSQSEVIPGSSLFKLFLPILAAMAGEALLKANYHRHALKHFGTSFKTPAVIDWGNLTTNLGRQWQVFTSQPWWPLPFWGMTASIAVLFYMLFIAFRRRRTGNTPAKADLIVMIAGCGLIALGSFVVTVVFTWVRLNDYGPRYLAQTHMFGALAGLCAVLFLGRLIIHERAESRLLIVISFIAVALLLVWGFPPAQSDPQYDKLQSVADGLVERRNQIVLLGGYWDTYVLASLAAPGQIIPVPADDQLVRTPWTPELMRASHQVVVVHHVFPSSGEVETPPSYDTFGDGEHPSTLIDQHGVTLRLALPRWYQEGGYTFSLYDNESERHSQ